MAPIEVLFAALVVMFALIGMTRGYLRELGVTTVMMGMLYVLDRFEPYIESGLEKLMGGATFGDGAATAECLLMMLVVSGVAFISYHGATLDFPGELPSRTQGLILGAVTGTLNGYLIAGTIWFYLDKFSYPFGFIGMDGGTLSTVAQQMIDYLPSRLLGQPVFLGESLLLYLTALLILGRVLR